MSHPSRNWRTAAFIAHPVGCLLHVAFKYVHLNDYVMHHIRVLQQQASPKENRPPALQRADDRSTNGTAEPASLHFSAIGRVVVLAATAVFLEEFLGYQPGVLAQR